MEPLHGFFTNPSIFEASPLGYGGFQGNGLPGSMEHIDVPPSLNVHTATGNIVSQNYGSFADENKGLLGTELKFEKKKGSDKKIRKARYAFQTRSHVDILDDGYRWRKYGQKSVKNNKFPRSYYLCTHQGCDVKKQIQRLTKDEGMVLTTYEGMHSHPIQKSNDNFEHILGQMQIYNSF